MFPFSCLPLLLGWPGWVKDYSSQWVFGVLVLGAVMLLSIVGRSVQPRFVAALTEVSVLIVPAYVVVYLCFAWIWGNPSNREENGWFLLASAVIAIAAWFGAASVRYTSLSARLADSAAFEQMSTEFLALKQDANSVTQRSENGKAAYTPLLLTGPEVPADTPLSQERIPGYIQDIDEMIGFTAPVKPEERAIWSSGIGYLEVWRRLDYARNSLIGLETDKSKLEAQAAALAMRVASSNLTDETKDRLKDQIKDEADAGRGRRLFLVASSLSSFAHNAQRQLLQLQARLYWLVILIMFVAGAFFTLSVLIGGDQAKENSTTAVVLFLLGAVSGILSLLWNRRSRHDPVVGEDGGLFRVELARAFTLSGMAAILAVFLIANLPAITAEGSNLFISPTATETPASTNETTNADMGIATGNEDPDTSTEEQNEETPVPTETANLILPVVPMLMLAAAQDDSIVAEIEESQDGDAERPFVTPAWQSPQDVFHAENTSAILIALLAGWLPERIFKSMTDYGSRLRLDIQSVSKTGAT